MDIVAVWHSVRLTSPLLQALVAAGSVLILISLLLVLVGPASWPVSVSILITGIALVGCGVLFGTRRVPPPHLQQIYFSPDVSFRCKRGGCTRIHRGDTAVFTLPPEAASGLFLKLQAGPASDDLPLSVTPLQITTVWDSGDATTIGLIPGSMVVVCVGEDLSNATSEKVRLPEVLLLDLLLTPTDPTRVK